MKHKPSLAQKMWITFTSQFVLAICVIASAVFTTLIMLHVQEKSNQDTARLLPAIHQELQKEQDLAKLRHEATVFLDETVADGTYRESALRFIVKMSALYGVGLLVCCSTTGICAYKLGRESHTKLPLSVSD